VVYEQVTVTAVRTVRDEVTVLSLTCNTGGNETFILSLWSL